MAIQEKLIGTRLMYIDRVNNLLFTKTELKNAQKRYKKELMKLQRGQ